MDKSVPDCLIVQFAERLQNYSATDQWIQRHINQNQTIIYLTVSKLRVLLQKENALCHNINKRRISLWVKILNTCNSNSTLRNWSEEPKYKSWNLLIIPAEPNENLPGAPETNSIIFQHKEEASSEIGGNRWISYLSFIQMHIILYHIVNKQHKRKKTTHTLSTSLT